MFSNTMDREGVQSFIFEKLQIQTNIVKFAPIASLTVYRHLVTLDYAASAVPGTMNCHGKLQYVKSPLDVWPSSEHSCKQQFPWNATDGSASFLLQGYTVPHGRRAMRVSIQVPGY